MRIDNSQWLIIVIEVLVIAYEMQAINCTTIIILQYILIGRMKIRREKQSPTDKQKYRAHTCAKEACAVSNSSVSGQQRAP